MTTHRLSVSRRNNGWQLRPTPKLHLVAQIGEESKAARACFAEQGLEAALRYLDMLPEGDPRDRSHRQYLAAQLTEEVVGWYSLRSSSTGCCSGMGLQMMVADWEPSPA